ncbi:MaoC/PaaZ C-terminal domain-containing protein [Xanthobacter tagetidis]|uniref:Dehydratase n=1 Tax=Xanthobacter tagetidis TaxID=60216 RepID=A0A3L7APM6_9HYPH|nr:MaoC/PaaZ C-terminal domain-containing protein [Xanthobacter tagetidis]MBB6307895.1 acyl dehydratase [Xanthobacter tagetidis]RLP81550.1 dehydratase [Xanthobacter tagetidis]
MCCTSVSPIEPGSDEERDLIGLPQTGVRRETGRFVFTEQEMLRFSRQYDPLPFHVDPEAGRQSQYGQLIGSGWHTMAVWMKLFVGAHDASGFPPDSPEAISPAGIGFGFKDLRWIVPVFPGDEIVFSTILDEVRASANRPGWAVFRRQALAARPEGEEVMHFVLTYLGPLATAIEYRAPDAATARA